MDIITLRPANIEDLPTLLHWDEQEHVIASDPDDDWNWQVELQKYSEWRAQLMAELNGKPLGFVQIIEPRLEETHYWGEIGEGYKAIDIWIGDEDNLGKGYGTEMMRQALNKCFEDEATHTVLIDPLESNTDAIRFYERIGFSFVEKRTFGSSHCCVYKITRGTWEKFV